MWPVLFFMLFIIIQMSASINLTDNLEPFTTNMQKIKNLIETNKKDSLEFWNYCREHIDEIDKADANKKQFQFLINEDLLKEAYEIAKHEASQAFINTLKIK